MRTWLLAGALALATITPATADGGKAGLGKFFTAAAEKAAEATVRVRVAGKDVSLGTVVDTKGFILTKGDELRGNITVRLKDGSEADAVLFGYHRETDLAMLKVNPADFAGDLVAVPPIADPAKAVPGNWVASTTMTSDPTVGVVSVGVRKLHFPENTVQKANKGFLGIVMDPLPEKGGVVIREVSENSAAAKVKLKVGDKIVTVDDKPVKELTDMQMILENFKPGDKVVVKVLRDKQEMTFEPKLQRREESMFDRGDMQNKMGSTLSNRRTGFPQVITHDTVVNAVDCGGPVVDLEGNVLGINIARAGRVETWALPASVVNPVIADLKAGKYPIASAKKDDGKSDTKAEKKEK
jgi:serine protease Do